MSVQSVIPYILPAVLAVLAIPIAYGIVKLLGEYKSLLESKKQDSQIQIIKMVCEQAIKSAEQVFGGGEGEKKIEYAAKFVSDELARHGIEIDEDQVKAYIEGFLYDLREWVNDFQYVEDDGSETTAQ